MSPLAIGILIGGALAIAPQWIQMYLSEKAFVEKDKLWHKEFDPEYRYVPQYRPLFWWLN